MTWVKFTALKLKHLSEQLLLFPGLSFLPSKWGKFMSSFIIWGRDTHPMVLQAYSWVCAQDSLLAGTM